MGPNNATAAIAQQHRRVFIQTPTTKKRKNDLKHAVGHAMNQVAEQMIPNKTPKTRRDRMMEALGGNSTMTGEAGE